MELQKVVVDKIKLELIAIPQVSSVSSLSSVSSPASVNLSRGGLSLWMEFQVSTEKKKSIRHRGNQLFAERVPQICGYIQMDRTTGCASIDSECDFDTIVEENFEVCDPGQGKTKFQNKINPERQCLHCN